MTVKDRETDRTGGHKDRWTERIRGHDESAYISHMRSLYSSSPSPPSTRASRHMISSCSTWLKLPLIFLVDCSICMNSHTIMSKKMGMVAFLSSVNKRLKVKVKKKNHKVILLNMSLVRTHINLFTVYYT